MIKAARRRRKRVTAVKNAGKALKAIGKREKVVIDSYKEVREEENTSREGRPGRYLESLKKRGDYSKAGG